MKEYSYHENGKVEVEKTYYDSGRIAIFKTFDEDGNLRFKEMYFDDDLGSAMSHEEWYSNLQLDMHIIYNEKGDKIYEEYYDINGNKLDAPWDDPSWYVDEEDY